MDNRSIDVISQWSEGIALALRLIWDNAPGGKATHFRIARLSEKAQYRGDPTSHHFTQWSVDEQYGTPTFILCWSADHDTLPLPYPMALDEATALITGWLSNAEYGSEPDHDGDNDKGWRMFTDCWGHVAGMHYAIIGVQPVWAMYGK